MITISEIFEQCLIANFHRLSLVDLPIVLSRVFNYLSKYVIMFKMQGGSFAKGRSIQRNTCKHDVLHIKYSITGT